MRRAHRIAVLVVPVLAWLVLGPGAPAAVADSGPGDGERVEVSTDGVCGRRSTVRLRLRAEDGVIRADLRLRTPTAGRWRLAVFHERRLVRRTSVRALRSRGGYSYRILLPDLSGPDAVWMRAVAPRGGEVCSAGTTVRADD